MPNGMPPFERRCRRPTSSAVTTFVWSFNASAFDLQPAGDVAAGAAFFLAAKGSARRATSRAGARSRGPDLSSIGRQMTVPELTRSLSSRMQRSPQGMRPRGSR